MTEVGGALAAVDLSELSQKVANLRRSMRIALSFVAGMVALLAVWFVTLALGGLHNELQWLVVSVVEACCVSLLTVLVYVVWNTRPTPTTLRIDSRGLQFLWGSGRVEELGWADLTRRFVLLDYSANPTAVAQLPPELLWEVRRFNRPPSPLTQSAFDAIIATAVSHGLVSKSEYLANPRLGWAACRAVRFGASVNKTGS